VENAERNPKYACYNVDVLMKLSDHVHLLASRVLRNAIAERPAQSCVIIAVILQKRATLAIDSIWRTPPAPIPCTALGKHDTMIEDIGIATHSLANVPSVIILLRVAIDRNHCIIAVSSNIQLVVPVKPQQRDILITRIKQRQGHVRGNIITQSRGARNFKVSSDQ